MEAAYFALEEGAARLALGEPRRGDLLQLLVDGEAKDVIAARLVQKVQCFRAQVVAVAAHQNADLGPVLADAADHMG